MEKLKEEILELRKEIMELRKEIISLREESRRKLIPSKEWKSFIPSYTVGDPPQYPNGTGD